MKYFVKNAVLLVGFNRPDVIKETFDHIKRVKPKKLYVAIDAPRDNIDTDGELVDKVKEIVSEVNWECDVQYKFNEKNLGAEKTVSNGISWALEQEEALIILEEDIVAPASFFRFVDEMLEKYKYEDRVCMISGSNFTPVSSETDYYFSKYGHIWGWAVWRRSWQIFDLSVQVESNDIQYQKLKKTFTTPMETIYHMLKFRRMQEKGAGNNTWDNCWGYLHRSSGKLAIVPKVNLVSNIGVYGLHNNGRRGHHYMKTSENFICSKHPQYIEVNNTFDSYHFKNHLYKGKKIRLFLDGLLLAIKL